MRLIGVACVGRKLSQIPRLTCATCEIQQALETQHRLKHLRTIADRRGKPALELSAAESDPLTELLNSTMRMLGEPVDGGASHSVRRVSVRQLLDQCNLHRRPSRRQTSLFSHSLKPGARCPIPHI